MASVASSEEHKALGNKAFGEKDYDKAITHYTDAIRADRTNHVFFSNRSASYAGKEDYQAALEDAKECIRLDPTFVKGYYRLATAQLGSKEYSAAMSVIKQGLQVEPENLQLQRLLRTAHQIKREETKQKQGKKSGSGFQMPSAGGGTMDASISKELQDLRQQFITTNREYNTVQADIQRATKHCKSSAITKSELEKLGPSSEENSKLYRGIGKVFLLSNRDNVMEHLDKSMEEQQTKETELTQKAAYLEKRLKSQQQNMEELAKNK